MTAEELHESLLPPTADQALEIGAAYLEQDGDLDEFVWYQLGACQPTPAGQERVWEELSELRELHFAETGEPMPPYAGGWI